LKTLDILDRSAPVLLATQVEQWIRERILAGEFRVREKIPCEAELAALLKVSRPTIKTAIARLVRMDVLDCRPHIGSFVKRRPPVNTELRSIVLCFPNLRDPFLYQLSLDLESVAHTLDLSVTVVQTRDDAARESEHLKRLKYDDAAAGLVLISDRIQTADRLDDNFGKPVVVVGPAPDRRRADYITIDNRFGVFQVIDYLYSLGHRRLGYLCGELYYTVDPRKQAFREALAARRLRVNPAWIVRSPLPDEAGGREAMCRLLSETVLPTAVFCESDTTAIGAMQGAAEHGLKIPGDLSVAGFDNIHAAAHLPTPLTTVNYPTADLARQTMTLLMRRISPLKISPPFETILLRPRLVIRQSCAAPRPPARP